VEYVKKFNLPLLMLGGGGYTIKAVSRAWAYETGLAAGQRLGMRRPFFFRASSFASNPRTDSNVRNNPKPHTHTEIPSNEYYEYFGPDYNLDVRANNMEDMNTPEFMDKLKRSIFENLRDKTAAPSVQMQGEF
jgi:histone deacetylase 1/2